MLLTDKGKVLLLGDNSSGQIIENHNTHSSIYKRPYQVGKKQNYNQPAINIHAGDQFSAMTI